MQIADAAVDDGNNDVRASGTQCPCILHRDVGSCDCFGSYGAVVAQTPLLREEWVIELSRNADRLCHGAFIRIHLCLDLLDGIVVLNFADFRGACKTLCGLFNAYAFVEADLIPQM